MEKARYQEIRKSVDLKADAKAVRIQSAQDLFLIAATAWILFHFPHSPLRFLAIPMLSVLMFRGFSMMHDAVHGAVSKRRSVNDTAGVLYGALCLLPFAPWRHVHLQHHFWSGNVDKDPVMALIRTYPKWPKFFQKTSSFFWRYWLPILATFQYFVFWFHSTKYLLKNLRSPLAVASTVSPVIVWSAAICLMPSHSFLQILVPAVALYFIAVEVVNFPHHLGLPQFHGETKIPIWNQHAIARSCTYPRWIARWVVLNFNYHIEHHMFPDVAWYHLDKLHEIVKDEIPAEYNTDPQFAWILKNRPKDLGAVLVTAPESTAPVSPEKMVA